MSSRNNRPRERSSSSSVTVATSDAPPTLEQSKRLVDAAQATYVLIKHQFEGCDSTEKEKVWEEIRGKDILGKTFPQFDAYRLGNFSPYYETKPKRANTTKRKNDSESLRRATPRAHEIEELVLRMRELRVEQRGQPLRQLRGRRMRYLQWTEQHSSGGNGVDRVWFDYPLALEAVRHAWVGANVKAKGRGASEEKEFRVTLSGTHLHLVLTKIRTKLGDVKTVSEVSARSSEEVGVRMFPWIKHWWEDPDGNPKLRSSLGYTAGFGGWKTWCGDFVFSRALLVDEEKFLDEWPANTRMNADEGARATPTRSDECGAWLPHAIDDWLHKEWEHARRQNNQTPGFRIFAPLNAAFEQGLPDSYRWS